MTNHVFDTSWTSMFNEVSLTNLRINIKFKNMKVI